MSGQLDLVQPCWLDSTPVFRELTPVGEVAFPSLEWVSIDPFRRAAQFEEHQRVWVLLELLIPGFLDILDELPMHELNAILVRWETFSGVSAGEMFKTVSILDNPEQRRALESDLIDKGLRLRDCPSERFNWRDLWAIIRHLPITSSLISVMFPDRAGWTKEAYLLAEAVDTLHWLQWAETKDGRKGLNRPRPIERPGITPPPRDGSKPKAQKLSTIKKIYSRIRGGTSDSEGDRAKRLSDAFGGG